jgi:two-component system sensor histidine kinase/response regulator
MPLESETTLENLGFAHQSKVRIMNLICIISSLLSFVTAYIGRDSFPYTISLCALAFIFIGSFILNNSPKVSLIKYVVPLATTLWITYMCFAFSKDLGTQNYLVIALVALCIFSAKRSYRLVSVTLILIAAVIISLYQRYYPPFFVSPRAVDYLFIVNVFTPLIIIAIICWNVVKDSVKRQSIIEEQKRALEDSNKFKDQVLSIIGHDMRSPFNSAKSLIHLIDNDLLSKEEKQLVIQELKSDIDLSLQTLDNILAWASQAYYGSVLDNSTKKEQLDIYSIVEKAILSFNHLAAQKKIELINAVPKSTYVWGDIEQLSFVFRNLTSNAFKFSHAGQQILIDAKSEDGKTTFAVKDNGIGMGKEILNSLFKINNRASQQGTAREKGSGLGLIFCKEFIENNDGQLWLENEQGTGTTVYFSLRNQL